MSKIANALKDEIARVARKEVKLACDPLKKQLANQRTAIAGLRKQLALRTQELNAAVRQLAKSDGAKHTRMEDKGGGFDSAGFRSLRDQLSLTRRAWRAFLKVSSQSIRKWEEGTEPRAKYQQRIAKLIAKTGAREPGTDIAAKKTRSAKKRASSSVTTRTTKARRTTKTSGQAKA